MARVLIVEDDPLMLRLYQKAFSFEGYDVDIAGDGAEGLKKARESKPTLIILDIMMPRMNGLEFLDSLKVIPEIKTIPVVVLTNLAGDKDAETALMKGAVKYIVKSQHDPKEVVAMVKEILLGYTREEIPSAVN